MANLATDGSDAPQMTSREFMFLVHLRTIWGPLSEVTANAFDEGFDPEFDPGFKVIPLLLDRGYVKRENNYILLTDAGHDLLVASGYYWKP